jgi:hypothetical protein
MHVMRRAWLEEEAKAARRADSIDEFDGVFDGIEGRPPGPVAAAPDLEIAYDRTTAPQAEASNSKGADQSGLWDNDNDLYYLSPRRARTSAATVQQAEQTKEEGVTTRSLFIQDNNDIPDEDELDALLNQDAQKKSIFGGGILKKKPVSLGEQPEQLATGSSKRPGIFHEDNEGIPDEDELDSLLNQDSLKKRESGLDNPRLATLPVSKSEGQINHQRDEADDEMAFWDV